MELWMYAHEINQLSPSTSDLHEAEGKWNLHMIHTEWGANFIVAGTMDTFFVARFLGNIEVNPQTTNSIMDIFVV